MWTNIDVKIPDLGALTKDIRFPNNPTSEGFLDNFDSPYGIGDKYGLQLHSIFVAPETGYYIFMVACDDACIVYLTVASQSKKKILEVNQWSSRYEWTK